MQKATESLSTASANHFSSSSFAVDAAYAPSSILLCNWHVLRRQLLQQWTLLTSADLAETGPNCRRIAALISQKYGIATHVVENYLRNFERTIPLL